MPRLAVLIGPNGSGKSNFVDLLRLIAEACQGQLVIGLNKRGGFQNVAFGFDALSEIRIEVALIEVALNELSDGLSAQSLAEVKKHNVGLEIGLRGLRPGYFIAREQIRLEPGGSKLAIPLVTRDAGDTVFRWTQGPQAQIEERKTVDGGELAIFQVRDPARYPVPYAVLQEIQNWTFYRDIDVGPESPVRQPALIRPALQLQPDGANLSSVLYSIQQNHSETWDEILEILATAYPDFRRLTVPAEGGDGKVILRWWEKPYEKQGLSANLLSDGTLKLLCLVVILKSPEPPPLICIDEPELGLHPDWIELVAELLQDAAARTQVIVASHSPQIVAKLAPEQVIVTEKHDGETSMEQLKTDDLRKWLKDFSLSDLWLAGHLGGRP